MRAVKEIPGDAEFLREFARFEYALKESGYYYIRSGKVYTAWDCFKDGTAERQDWFDLASRDPDINYLINRPPDCRVLKGGVLGWEPQPPITTTRDLIEATQRVRNNLFHGDKSDSPSNPENDPERNKKLIRAGRKVLQMLLDQRGDLAVAFDTPEL